MNRVKEYMGEMTIAASVGVLEMAQVYAQEVRDEHNRGTAEASGRIRQDGHQASAPGDPPARDTNALYNGIGATRKASLLAIAGVHGEAEEYAKNLEHGDVDVLPRPMWRPVVERTKADGSLVDTLRRHVKANL